MEDSLFTKIIKGEIPAHRIYEDERTLAFLDIHPVQPGHVLVIPKTQIAYIWDLTPVDYQALMESVQKIGRHIRETLGVRYIGEQVIGVDVPHAHVHLIPFDDVSEFRRIPDMSIEPDHDTLAEMAKKLAL